MTDCKARRELHFGGPLLAGSIIALAVIATVAGTYALGADLVLAPAAGPDRGVRIMRILGLGGETCQVQINNVVLRFTQVIQAERFEEEDAFEPADPGPGWRILLLRGTADEFVYSPHLSADAARNALERVLQKEVAAVTGGCELTDGQRLKIELAGRGDIQRLLGRAGELKLRFEEPAGIVDIEQFQNWITRLSQESTRLQSPLMFGPFGAQSLFAKTLRQTLTAGQLDKLGRLQGILIATADSTENGARPVVASVRFNDPNRLETILKEWDLAATRVYRLDCNFIRMKYDPVFQVEFRGEGSLAVDRRGRALYKIAAAHIIPGAESRKISPGGARYELKSDSPDRFHWIGDKVIRVDDRARTYEEAPIPPARQHAEFRPEPPALPEEVGSGGRKRQPATDLDLIAGFNTLYDEPLFGWTKPFLLGMPPDELKRRFKVTLLSEDDAEVRLEFEAIWPRDKLQLSSAQLILSKGFYRPRALRMVGPSGAETVHVFKDVAVNAPDDREPLDRPNLAGFRQILNNRPAQP